MIPRSAFKPAPPFHHKAVVALLLAFSVIGPIPASAAEEGYAGNDEAALTASETVDDFALGTMRGLGVGASADVSTVAVILWDERRCCAPVPPVRDSNPEGSLDAVKVTFRR